MREISGVNTLFTHQPEAVIPLPKIILFVLSLFITALTMGQEDFRYLPPKFQNLSLSDGLSNLAIHSICQDDLGYIWIGTARGLNRYDGISFKHYYYSDDGSSLSHDNIVRLHKAPNGDIFCSTVSGTNIFSIEEERFLNEKSNLKRFISFANHDSVVLTANPLGGIFQYSPESAQMERVKNLPANIVIDVLINDEQTGIWGKAFNNQFILNYNPATSNYEKYILPNTDTLTTGGTIALIKKHLITSTNSSISVFNIENRTFEDLSENFSGLIKIQNETINFIKEVEENILWIGTKTSGLYIYNMVENSLINFHKSENFNFLNSDHLTCILKDKTDNIWLGSFDRGVDVAFERRRNFNFDLALHNFTKDKFITSITTDQKGTYYFGTRLNGLHIYNSKTKKTAILNQENSFIKDNHIRKLLLSSTNELWISSEKQLQILNLKNGKHRDIQIPRPNNGLVSFCESDGKVFAGSDRQGLLVFSLDGELLDRMTQFGINITEILSKGDGKLVVAAYGQGIFEYDCKKKVSKSINDSIMLPPNKLNEIITCYFDLNENMWIGNFKYGLYRLSKKDKKVTIYTMENGLPSNDITGIIEDNYRNIWVSTAYGLSMLNIEGKFTNYSYNEGLENIQFHQKATLKDEHGTLFFGGNFGLTFFNPRVLDFEKTQAPKVMLETLKVSNKEVKPKDETNILNQTLALTSAIELNHHYPSFSIEFRGFDYVAAKALNYAYFLEGFDKSWNYVNNRTFASYQNLNRGNYIFKVKAQNNNGTWSEQPAILHIKIKPAPWLTIWAYLAYIFTILLITFITFRLILLAKLYKKELEIEHNERVRENEISEMKMRFFTNISHEIRTPVTLIKGNVDFLLTELKEKNIVLKSTEGLKNSTERIIKLINQLLTFRKLENDTLDLEVRKEDVIKITNELIESYRFTGNLKGVTLNILTKEKELIVQIDRDKYEKILNNLIANSLRFSKKNGFINIVVEKQSSDQLNNDFVVDGKIKNYLQVSVIDNGKGIPASLLPHIFDRFVHYDEEKSKPDYSGSGIGLNFTKRLIELHKGAIIVKSQEKVETYFSFILPADEGIYPPENVLKTIETETKEAFIPEPDLPANDQPKKVILLAEDDIELNKTIQNALAGMFKVIPAYDGKEALKLAKNQLPDIIISDIMMPVMDGITLCRSIREDELISHIPIVLLTAKAEVENKIMGFKYGADEYITKPFDFNLLKTRIQNLIKQRSLIQEYYKKAMPVEFKADTVNHFEINFMKKINKVVTENYQLPEFNVHQLAEHMNMSRTSFYRKFMNIADSSPKDYITNFRINKSIELIQSGYESFGEISCMCGFSSQSIFSLAFKKAKGVSPLQYKKSLAPGQDKKEVSAS